MIETTASPSASATRLPIIAIVAVSAAAVSFLLWLLYVHHPPSSFADRLNFLPTLNAVLNGLSAIALVTGYSFIRRRRIAAHRASMMTAFAFSSLFLVSYILNHALHGDTLYPGHGTIRTVYLSILASHVLLSVIVLPMVLTTFFFALTNRLPQHRGLARFTFPIWLYVSVTGVVVRVMLARAL